jgi:type II secretory pathway component GspD/PulD (secretin)
MKIRISSLFTVCAVLCILASSISSAAVGRQERVDFSDGLVSVKCKGTPLKELLSDLADTMNIEILLFDDDVTETVNVNIEKVPLEEALWRVLRGYNYAVFFGDETLEAGVSLMGGKLSGKSSSGGMAPIAERRETTASAYENVERDNITTKKMALEKQIAQIERQIESGHADEWYEKWISIKDEKFVTHPRERLAMLKERLENEAEFE